MNDLTTIQPGDHVALPAGKDWSCAPPVSHHVYRVTRLTATGQRAEAISIDAPHLAPVKFRLSDGKMNKDEYKRMIRATPELLAQHQREKDARQRWILASQRISDLEGKVLHQLKLNTEQLEALADAWDRIKAMDPGSAT